MRGRGALQPRVRRLVSSSPYAPPAQAYADYEDMINLTEELIAGAAEAVCGSTSLQYQVRPPLEAPRPRNAGLTLAHPLQGTPIELARPWRRVTMADLVKEKIPAFDFYALREVRYRPTSPRRAAKSTWTRGR